MSILAQIHAAVNNGKTLQEAIDEIVPGADPTFWAKKVANFDPTKKQSKKKPRRSSRSRKTSRRTFQASSVLAKMTLSGAEQQAEKRGKAMADLVDRVNNCLVGVA